jgi:replicative DNA helicase
VTDLPHLVEVEQQLIGGLMMVPGRIPEAVARGGVTLFAEPAHIEIFRVMMEADKAGTMVSPPMVMRTPSLQPFLEQLGGPAYIARMAASAIATSQLHHYIDALEDARDKRGLLTAMDAAKAAMMDKDATAADIAVRLEAAAQAVAGSSTAVTPVSLMSATTTALEQVDDAYHGVVPNVVQSGIHSLDKMVMGFGPGELILLGGRPSMGKTGLALSMALNAARSGHGVIFASLEMTPDAIALRAMSEGTGHRGGAVSYAQARRGDMTEAQYRNLAEATKKVAGLPLFFLPRRYAEPAILMSGIKQCLRRLPEKSLPLVVVDYLQLMKVTGTNRFEQITAISMALKDIAMRLELPVIALSQLSRAVEQRDDKRPTLADLRESGQLEQDADLIMFAYRDEYYLAKEEPSPEEADDHADWRAAMEKARNRLEIIVAKQRQGETGTARVRFNPALNLVWED